MNSHVAIFSGRSHSECQTKCHDFVQEMENNDSSVRIVSAHLTTTPAVYNKVDRQIKAERFYLTINTEDL